MVLGIDNRLHLRAAGSAIIWNYADLLTSLELLNDYLTLAMSTSSGGFVAVVTYDIIPI